MENEKYYQTFRDLGIKVEPLPSNYNPEEYGRRLLSMSQPEYGVSYAASTDYVVIQQNNAEIYDVTTTCFLSNLGECKESSLHSLFYLRR